MAKNIHGRPDLNRRGWLTKRSQIGLVRRRFRFEVLKRNFWFVNGLMGINIGYGRPSLFAIFLVAIIILAGGCFKVGPDFMKPDTTVNPGWMETKSYKQLTAKAEDYRDWWRSFNDPVLDKLIQTAYHQNLSLQIAGNEFLRRI